MAAESEQLKYLQDMVTKQLQFLKKELKKTQQSSQKYQQMHELLIPEVWAIQEEKFVNIHTKSTRKMHRIFVRGCDHKEYSHVGWLLSNDVDNCLICNVQFGMFCYKHYCRACGNIVCIKCRPYSVRIEQLESLNAQHVCVQCFWGQVS